MFKRLYAEHPVTFVKSFYSKVANIVFVRGEENTGDYTAQAIDLTYCAGSGDECKQSTMLEF